MTMPRLSARLTRLEAEAAERIALVVNVPAEKQLAAWIISEFDPEEWNALPPGETPTAPRFDADHGALVFHPDSAQAKAIIDGIEDRSHTDPNGG